MSMAGYTKLFSSILASTIWGEDDKTRIVWITLLAMAGKNGVAEGSAPGLANMARVSLQECEAALAKLSAPDKYSRTTEHEGRRIEAIDGGWLLLNHGKYRAKMNADERREYNRLKQEEWRAKKKKSQTLSNVVNDCNGLSALSAQSTASASASGKEEGVEREENRPDPGTAPTMAEWVKACEAQGIPAWYAEKKFHVHDAKDWRSGKTPILWTKVIRWAKQDYEQDGRPTTPQMGPIKPKVEMGQHGPIKLV